MDIPDSSGRTLIFSTLRNKFDVEERTKPYMTTESVLIFLVVVFADISSATSCEMLAALRPGVECIMLEATHRSCDG